MGTGKNGYKLRGFSPTMSPEKTARITAIAKAAHSDTLVRDFARIQEDYYAAMEDWVAALARELDVPMECANAVEYLRTRRRWTPEMEARLIASYKDPTQTPVPIEAVLSGEWR